MRSLFMLSLAVFSSCAGMGQQITNYSLQCEDIDRTPLDAVTFDAEGRPVFTGDEACGQQFRVYPVTRGDDAWNFAHDTDEGWESQDFDTFNAIHSGVTFGVVPEELRASGHTIRELVAPGVLEPGRAYVAALLIGCSIDGGNSGVERTVTFTMPAARDDTQVQASP